MRRTILIGAALAILAGAIYGRVGRNGFIDYDDPAYVTDNPHVRAGVSLETAAWALTATRQSNWHPLTWMSHALDVDVFGLEPAGHHLVSAGLHAANAVLLFLALQALTGAAWRSAVVAALFAAHPLHVESVAWAAERKDVLSTFFAMLVLLLYAQQVARPSRAGRVAIPVAFALGLMAKPMLVTLPFVLLLLDAWPLRRWRAGASRWALVREKLPLFALAAGSSVVTWIAQRRGGAMTTLDALPLATRLANAAVAYVTYLAKMVWPSGLAVLYPIDRAIPAGKIAGALAIVAAITALAIRARRSAPYLATGWFWYLGTLVPVIGIVQVGQQSAADRYTYIPLIGIFIVLAWGLADLAGSSRPARAALGGAAVLAIAGCSVVSFRQVALWRDSETLFRHALASTTGNFIVLGNLGGVLLREGRLDEAVSVLEQARKIRPNDPPTLSNLGVAAMQRRKLDEAAAFFREALAAQPSHREARLNLDVVAAKQRASADFERGNQLRDQHRFADAEAAYREAITLDPGFALPHNNLAIVLALQGKNAEAERLFNDIVRADPRDASAHFNFGTFLQRLGRDAEANAQFEEARRLAPGPAKGR